MDLDHFDALAVNASPKPLGTVGQHSLAVVAVAAAAAAVAVAEALAVVIVIVVAAAVGTR